METLPTVTNSETPFNPVSHRINVNTLPLDYQHDPQSDGHYHSSRTPLCNPKQLAATFIKKATTCCTPENISATLKSGAVTTAKVVGVVAVGTCIFAPTIYGITMAYYCNNDPDKVGIFCTKDGRGSSISPEVATVLYSLMAITTCIGGTCLSYRCIKCFTSNS